MDDTPILGVIRASSWPDLLDCGLRWYYRHILGIQSPSGQRAHIGTSIHHGLAAYDLDLLDGADADPEGAVALAIEELWHPSREVAWDDEDITRAKAEPIVAKLVRAAIERTAGTEYVAVETMCQGLDIETKHGVVRLMGTIDRVRCDADGRLGIRDLKSGERAVTAAGKVETKKHFLQTGIYRLMAAHELGEAVDAPSDIVGLQTNGVARVEIAPMANELDALLGSPDGKVPGLIELAAQTLATGNFLPNPGSNLCSPRYCANYARCPYHQ